MKRLFLFFFIVNIYITRGQNLVPNNSLEAHITCNSFSGTIKDAPPWFFNNYPFGGTAYYFHPCSPFLFQYLSVPRNLTDTTGYQWPRSGLAYGGINMYYNQFTNYRQYIEVKLLDTLLANQEYCVEFYVSLCNNSFYGIDQIGACLTADTLNCSPQSFSCLINATPQIKSPVGIPILDTLNWIKINGKFTAVGNEQYITIGNFYPDSLLTKAINNSALQNSTFYYIDDVSVTLCDSSNGIFEPRGNDLCRVFPNPAEDFITIKLSITEPAILEISNVQGKIMLVEKLLEKTSKLDISSLDAGIYFYQLKTKSGKMQVGKVTVRK